MKTLTICRGVTYIGPYLSKVSQLWRKACVLADPELFFYATVPFNFSENYIEKNHELLEQAKGRYALFDYPAFVRLMDAFLKLDVTEQLSSITVPTCIIGGEQDLIKPPYPYSMIMHENIPNSEMHIIPETGHVVTWEKPEEFNSVVLGFLSKHLL